MPYIYHIADTDRWKAAQHDGEYNHPTLDTEGFIHCSTQFQLEKTANRYFLEYDQILILCIDTTKLKAPVKYEASSIGEFFPHIYGTIPIEAVATTRYVTRGDDNRYTIPHNP